MYPRAVVADDDVFVLHVMFFPLLKLPLQLLLLSRAAFIRRLPSTADAYKCSKRGSPVWYSVNSSCLRTTSLCLFFYSYIIILFLGHSSCIITFFSFFLFCQLLPRKKQAPTSSKVAPTTGRKKAKETKNNRQHTPLREELGNTIAYLS